MMRIKHIALLALVLGALAGCIREDRDDCKGDITLRFRYDGDGTTDIFPAKIDRVRMYVYSASDNLLAGEYTYDRQALTEYQGARLALAPGDYRIVCWGNAAGRTQLQASGDDARVAEPAYFEGSDAYTGTDSLYYATVDLNVPSSLERVDELCPFAGAHIKMRVKLKGFADAVLLGTASRTPANVSFVHTGCPQWTDFTNTPAAATCDVRPEMAPDPADATSYILNYNVLRFGERDDSNLVVSDPRDGNTVHTVSLADFVARYGIRIENRNEVTIPVLVELLPTAIRVVEWEVEEVEPGFDKNNRQS